MSEILEDFHPDHLTGAIKTAFLLMMNVLILQKDQICPKSDYPASAECYIKNHEDLKFDFIIVGAGAAGCALANRLTENQRWKVLLIEAGDDPSTTSDVPAFYPTLPKTNEDWQFKTENDSYVCQGMVGKVCHITKGKVLGGTSTINNLHYMRGIDYDFEKWYAWGNAEWDAASVEKTYTKVEKYVECPEYPCPPDRYGFNGDITINKFKSQHLIKNLIVKASGEINNINLKEHYLGYKEIPATLDGGTRVNMAKAFLTNIKNRRNLYVIKECTVTKLIIPDIREKEIKGVEGLINNLQPIQLKAVKEVILSAGAINTPKIMLHSGLGPQNLIGEMDLPLVADLKVGENLQDHFGVPIFVRVGENETAGESTAAIDETYFFVMHKTGPLTQTNINDLVGFINTGEEPFELPNLAIYHYFFKVNDLKLKDHMERIGLDTYITQSLILHNLNQNLIMFMPTLLKPKSRGAIFLNKTNTFGPPIIKGNFLSSDEDLIALIHGYKYIAEIVKTPSFVKQKAQLLQLDIPNCRNLKFSTDSFVKCHIRNVGYPQGNVVGTAKMGPNVDQDAVVDENLLVKKVTGLRIVDASFMPEIVSANIQATMAMVGEKISKAIKTKWLKDEE